MAEMNLCSISEIIEAKRACLTCGKLLSRAQFHMHLRIASRSFSTSKSSNQITFLIFLSALLGKNNNRFFWINEKQAKFTFIQDIPDQVNAKSSDWKAFNDRNLMHMSFYGM